MQEYKTGRFLIFLLFLFIGSGFTAYGQETKIDSLENLLEQTTNDSIRADLLVKLGLAVDETDLNQALHYSLQALDILEASQATLKKAILLNDIGYYYWMLGKFHHAIEYFQDAIPLYEEMDDFKRIARTYNNIGAVYWGINDYNNALDMYQQSYVMKKEIDYDEQISLIINNIGMVYQRWGMYDKALEYHNEGLAEAIKADEPFEIAYSYINIGECLESKQEYDKAFDYYQKAFDNYQKINKNDGLALATDCMGDMFYVLKNYEKANNYYKNSLYYAKAMVNLFRVSIAKSKLAKNYIKLGRPDSARIFIARSLEIANENGYKEVIRDNQFMLSKLEEMDGNIVKAFDIYKSAAAIKDSLLNEDKIAKFTELQIKYYNDKQTRENALLRKNNEIYRLTIKQQENIRNALIFGSLMILVILGILIYNRASIKRMNTILEKQNADIRKMNNEKEVLISNLKHEILERETIQEKLRSSEAKYRMMVESSGDGVVIFQTDHFAYHNKAFRLMLDYTDSEIDQIKLNDLLSQDSFKELTEVHKGLNTQEAETASRRIELEFIKKDGSSLYIEANISAIDYLGKKANFAVLRDITHQKEILQAIKTSADQTKSLKGFIPICAGCNKIRDEELPGSPWISPVEYITQRLPKIKFTHSMCPDCMEKWYPEFMNNAEAENIETKN